MANVYVLNKGPHDYSQAERFGDIVFCTDGNLDKFDTAQMYRAITEAMKNSESDDYILLGSLTSLCCVACAIFAAKHWKLNLLIHRQDGYVERTLLLNNIR